MSVKQAIKEIEDIFNVEKHVDLEQTEEALVAELRELADELDPRDELTETALRTLVNNDIEFPKEIAQRAGVSLKPEKKETEEPKVKKSTPKKEKQATETAKPAPPQEPESKVFSIEPDEAITWRKLSEGLDEMIQGGEGVGLEDVFTFFRQFQPSRPILDVLSDIKASSERASFAKYYTLTKGVFTKTGESV